MEKMSTQRILSTKTTYFSNSIVLNFNPNTVIKDAFDGVDGDVEVLDHLPNFISEGKCYSPLNMMFL